MEKSATPCAKMESERCDLTFPKAHLYAFAASLSFLPRSVFLLCRNDLLSLGSYFIFLLR